MALRDTSLRLPKLFSRAVAPGIITPQVQCRSYASDVPSPGAKELQDLESDSPFSSAPISDSSLAKQFDPVARSRRRRTQLPPSRYHFRPPRYYRGPLHPHRAPPDWDPSSRGFIPGPFTLPRVQQTYESSIDADFMTLCYIHCPPGFKPPPIPDRLRPWDDSSPYHKNRPRRAPRGGNVLQLLRQPVDFNNIPKLERITVNTYVKEALRQGSAPLHVAGMAIQAITNHRIEPHVSKSNVPTWGVIKGKQHVGVSAELRGEEMYHFIGKLIDVVLPRIKDWPGVKATSGDSSGNITLGLEPKMVALFPEIEVNYD
ncbi:Mitochondrial Translation Optimization, partial [Ascosphaera pollenicola]